MKLNHNQLTRNIFLALILGSFVGYFFPQISPWVGWLGQVFKLSLSMIVMPIILTSIIGGMGSINEVGRFERLGVKTLLFFMFSTLIAVFVGLVLVNILDPGVREVPLVAPLTHQMQDFDNISLQEFVFAQIAKTLVNPFAALAENNVLGVIVFAILFGLALSRLGDRGQKVFEMNETVGLAINKIVSLIMRMAPLGIFGLLVDILAHTGMDVFEDLAWYIMCVVLGLSIHMFIVLPFLTFSLAKRSPWEFFRKIKPVLAVAFSTSSSSATLPISLNVSETELKVSPAISRFVLPLGATINMNGTALYEAVAALFVAQLYGVHLGMQGQIIVAFTATLAAVGAAGIPSAGTVTMALVLSAVGLPLEAIGLLLAVDRPLDMCRTAVNVAGDLVGVVVLQKLSQADLKTS
ncbi:MAG: dicarboxylate/amino acid:cation symporter [bacterium]|nr:dicarboxylate/amino acid:cation symporter [bacterium]